MHGFSMLAKGPALKTGHPDTCIGLYLTLKANFSASEIGGENKRKETEHIDRS